LTSINSNTDFPAGYLHPASHGSGLLGGGYAGFNYQINRLVIGIDGDYSRSNLTASLVDIGPLSGRTTNKFDQVKWVSTLAGRFGYAVDNWMIYAKVGAAWADFEGTYVNPTGSSISSNTRDGWTLGAGVEWGFDAHWSAKLEYDYANFGTTSFNATAATGFNTGVPFSATSALNMLKLGIAYRF
jgi:outer membrane immunogenic protein